MARGLRSPSGAERRARARAGLTLLEVTVAMPVILIAASMLASTLLAIAKQRTVARETVRVALAVQGAFERMRNERVADVWRLYNQEPFDDPNGPGTAPGAFFALPGLLPMPGARDGAVGEIRMPGVNVGTAAAPVWQVREDMVDTDLQMPRDLSGDSVMDAADHSGDYIMMPVHVRVRWMGRFGPREFEMHTLLTELPQ